MTCERGHDNIESNNDMKHFQNAMLYSKPWLIVTSQVDGAEAVTKTIEHLIKHRRRTSAPRSLGTRTCSATGVQGRAADALVYHKSGGDYNIQLQY